VRLTPGEWPWAYYMLLGIHVVLFLTGAGLTWGTDGVRGSAAAGNGGPAARFLLAAWGGVLTGVGARTASRRGSPMLATSAAALAVVAAASIYLQVGIGTSVWLGANLTTLPCCSPASLSRRAPDATWPSEPANTSALPGRSPAELRARVVGRGSGEVSCAWWPLRRPGHRPRAQSKLEC